jgi:hypothetical protein
MEEVYVSLCEKPSVSEGIILGKLRWQKGTMPMHSLFLVLSNYCNPKKYDYALCGLRSENVKAKAS